MMDTRVLAAAQAAAVNSGGSAAEVLDGLGPCTVVAIQDDAAFGHHSALAVVACFLLADGHLPVGLQQRHFAPFGEAGLPDAVHLRVVLAAPSQAVLGSGLGLHFIRRGRISAALLEREEAAYELRQFRRAGDCAHDHRTFPVPTARSSRHMPDSTPTLALGLALLRGPQDRM
jgi:hypothetical protein